MAPVLLQRRDCASVSRRLKEPWRSRLPARPLDDALALRRLGDLEGDAFARARIQNDEGHGNLPDPCSVPHPRAGRGAEAHRAAPRLNATAAEPKLPPDVAPVQRRGDAMAWEDRTRERTRTGSYTGVILIVAAVAAVVIAVFLLRGTWPG
jgi:hypothetical protein